MSTIAANTLSFHSQGRFIVFVNNDRVPSDTEWRAYADAFEQLGRLHSPVRLLVVTGGGTPTAKQRQRVGQLTEAMNARTAVVSDSIVARSIVTAFSWFNSEIKGFSAVQVPLALEYLELSSTEREWAVSSVQEMQAQLRIATRINILKR